jgi:hypothetical protein
VFSNSFQNSSSTGVAAATGPSPANAAASPSARLRATNAVLRVTQRRLRLRRGTPGAEVRVTVRAGTTVRRCRSARSARWTWSVPLLGFDRRGHRLGTGAGYYDRSFAFLGDQSRPAKPILVGIGYSFAERPMLPAESWDIQMDFVATERELINCTEQDPSRMADR